ncbi:MAG: electron transfer flavoprotein subunit beta/FixA family protein [Bdellovibrionaceae bacterium]|nr:electron transfer flavoprotein subunit beta/FixA family protein [Pseudobdellovibrionaceae bacterium]
MKIFVGIKQVPDTETKIKLLPNGAGVDLTGVKWVVNPYDEFAIEEAVKIKEKNPGTQVFAITLGPKQRASEVLRTALAMGCDEGVVVNSNIELDNLSVAKALTAAIKAEGACDLLLLGKLAIDDNGSAVGPMVAELLGTPHISVVSKLELSGSTLKVERDVEGGAKEVFEVSTPCVLTANKGLNMPRYASLPGIMKAKKKVLKEYEAEALGVSASTAKSKMASFSMPEDKTAVKMLTGDASAQAQELARLLREDAKVI